MKAVVAASNQEKALVGAFSVLTNLRMELFQALIPTLILVNQLSAHPNAPGGAGLLTGTGRPGSATCGRRTPGPRPGSTPGSSARSAPPASPSPCPRPRDTARATWRAARAASTWPAGTRARSRVRGAVRAATGSARQMELMAVICVINKLESSRQIKTEPRTFFLSSIFCSFEI